MERFKCAQSARSETADDEVRPSAELGPSGNFGDVVSLAGRRRAAWTPAERSVRKTAAEETRQAGEIRIGERGQSCRGPETFQAVGVSYVDLLTL
jgi:hypothetical protein